MLHRPCIPDDIYRDFLGYTKWQADAAAETTAICRWYETNAVGSGNVDRELYGKLKDFLVRYFAGKCAYCESEFASVAFGDVEHYRPKLKVTDDKLHRGYYWLAYTEKNLLPSCELCNRGKGKKNHFPVEGKRAYAPTDDLDAELPLLLNPYCITDCDCSALHLDFDCEEVDHDLLFNGEIKGLTLRGETSIRIYNLNRFDLVRRRAKSQRNGLTAFKLAFKDAKARQEWAIEWLGGHQEHASAIRSACLKWWRFTTREIDRLVF